MREKVAIDILIFYLKMMYDAEKKGELIKIESSCYRRKLRLKKCFPEIEENSKKYKRLPPKEKTWMTVPEIGNLLELKTGRNTGWFRKIILNAEKSQDRCE